MAHEFNFGAVILSLWKFMFGSFGLVGFWQVLFDRFGLVGLAREVWFVFLSSV